ncbi:aliphatic sulfonate ABC transporter permease SsuC [Kerstersia gyiorum]|uniref:Sulfonate transport system permease protein n=2 Tax=Kerstersia gyiorum TaxID=206506 RepID=A0A4Q7MAC0_9BURK|nr:sulfonate transport system permease protein [Kerstersia gyiorum]MCP1672107.1 sulfonate transport system permease protein [Kerstersia gyiorum]MCP1682836.1 sulfonate transport system permease protein [Kerstersia gyiorum]MCP1710202.1 sulfonate transport system permease protein [Kerstersia gyiorum]MCP1712981.1 sulfonate transport system permease protein [Kerstersia gyiorum]
MSRTGRASLAPSATAPLRAVWWQAMPWLIPILTIIVWHYASTHGLVSARLFPPPLEVLHTFVRLFMSGELWHHVGVSFARAAAGFTLGTALGLGLGLLTGLSRTGERLLDTTLQMLRNIPSLALVPLAIMWFGIDETTRIFLITFAALFPVYLNTYHGIRSLDSGLIEMARNYGLSGWRLLRYVVLPGAVPSILVGVRYALGVSWIVLIVAETISAKSGVGYMAMTAREFLQTDIVVLSIIIYALLGKSSDWAARLLERRWLKWHPSYQLAEARP